jgi:hypothetical protein
MDTGDYMDGPYRYQAWHDVKGALGTYGGYFRVGFDASRVVPTALENRMATVASYYCMKY